MTTLITLGCSWTWGVGASYHQAMTFEEYSDTAWDRSLCSQLSWRGLLSKRFNLSNINISLPASSNQQQFRLAKEFFSGPRYQEIKHEKIIVLWGITSTARNELFDSQTNQLTNFFYTDDNDLARAMTKFSYDHDYEVKSLLLEIQHWNSYFSALGIPCYWFDTFNHHHYKAAIPNLLGVNNNPRDLMSWLVNNNGGNNNDLDYKSNYHNSRDRYHKSAWKNDDDRVTYLLERGILNPYSFHPTQEGHRQLCNFFAESCSEFIDS